MILCCKHCPEEFKSLDLRNEVALKECCDALIAHIASKHSAWIQTGRVNIAKATQLIIWLLVMESHAAVPNTETFIHEED